MKLIHLPLEEYLFFGLQTLLTGLWVGRRLQRLPAREEVRSPALAAFAPLLLLGAPITAGGSGADRYAYLVHLLAWSLPVLAAQLVALALHHRAETGRVLRAVLPPALLCTLWLVSADHLAISAGVWRFGEGKHLGVYLASRPARGGALLPDHEPARRGRARALRRALRPARRAEGDRMIRAEKGGAHGRLIDAYVRRKVRRAFSRVWVRGALPAGPLLVYANHSNFWDGFVAHQLCEAAGWDGYCLMEEENLRRYPFLRRLGAFSIRRGEGRSSLESLRYAKALLRRPSAAVVLFPEGEHRPFAARPVELERGIELLARTANARCLPVAIRYAFFEEELPHVLLEVGEVHGPEPLAQLGDRLEALVQRVARAHSPEGFTPLLEGSPGVAERWARFKSFATGGRA